MRYRALVGSRCPRMLELALMQSCPKWERCNAPICPADPRWRHSTHLSGERVCFYLLEHAKDGGPARLSRVLPLPLAEAIAACHQEIAQPSTAGNLPHGHAVIGRAIAKAATTGSRIEAGEKLGRSRP
jgi:hypothetical protein